MVLTGDDLNFQSLTLADYLDKDQRPSFVVDLKSKSDNKDEHALKVVFVNQALKAANIVLDHPRRNGLRLPQSKRHRCNIADFIAWVNDAQHHENFQYQEHLWFATTVSSRWRVISGVVVLDRVQQAHLKKMEPVESLRSHSNDQEYRTASDDTQAGRSINGHRSDHPGSNFLDVLQFPDTASREHCRLVNDFDWSLTVLGPIEDWSPSLRDAILSLLCDPDPSTTFWGPDRILIYNQPFATLIGGKHPAALGSPAKIHFQPVWTPYNAIIREIEQTGYAARQNTYRNIYARSDVLEEIFLRATFTPIWDPSGCIIGVHNRTVEVTREIKSQRRLKTLLKLSEESTAVTSPGKIWQDILAAMQPCTDDLPFVAVYSIDHKSSSANYISSNGAKASDRENWHLEGSIGFPEDHPAILGTLDLDQTIGLAPALRLTLASTTGQPLLIQKSDNVLSSELFDGYPGLEDYDSVSRIVVCSISPSYAQESTRLVFAIKASQAYDEEYGQFLTLLSHRVEDIATSAILLEKERLRMEQTIAEAEYQREWISNRLIQQRKEAEASDFRFFNFAQHAPVGIYIVGGHGDVKYANNAFYDLFNIPRDDGALLAWRNVIHPDDLAGLDQHWEEVKLGKATRDVEYRVIRKLSDDDRDTKILYVRANAFAEFAEDGTMERLTGIIMDDSAQKIQELAVADRLADALEAKRAQENFMDMVSHEMRNPLSAMLQCAEEASQLLHSFSTGGAKDEYLEDKLTTMNEAIDTIQWCGRHQRQIIDDVLTISKLDSDLLTLDPVETRPVDVIERVLKMFASEIRSADIQILQSISADARRQCCMLDSSRVLQILINLVGNAIKFTRDRPIRKLELSVSTSLERPQITGTKFVVSETRQRRLPKVADTDRVIYVCYSVEDTGPGLTTEEMENLFARFKQASPRTHAQYGGSGLGLFISRELAEMHGGKIGLHSEVGEGSRFSFYVEAQALEGDGSDDTNTIPTTNGESQHERTLSEMGRVTSLSSPPSSPSNKTLLIVEDNLVNQKVLVRQIKKLGFKTATANHGQEALAIIKKSNWWHEATEATTDISVVLCDLEMPVMDGMACIRHIRQWQSEGLLKGHIPVLAVTGNARVEQVRAAREAGFDDVVCKPYSVPDLVPMITRLERR